MFRDNRREPSETSSLLPPDDAGQAAKRAEARGYVFMALSGLGFALNSVCVKALALAGFPSLQIVFARSVLQLLLGLLGCAVYRANPLGPAGLRHWLVARGAAGAFGNACFFYAVSQMALADATVVFFTGPVFSALFASWLLGEPYTRVDRAASVVCLAGIVLVVRPAALFGTSSVLLANNELAGAIAALVGAMSGALAYCVVRRVGSAVHFMVHVVYFGFISMIGSSAAMFAFQAPRLPVSSREWALMGMLGAFAYTGQVLLNRGLQLAPAGPGTLMRNLDVVFAFIFGITLFDEILRWSAVFGALVIVGCTAAMGLHKWNARQ
ncbi:hypothetical protein GGF46_004781 [Coemansia sp. RSA 552]|nr:hypothetical protein GGF46_004781 [Coemansia sp. RSA 552]